MRRPVSKLFFHILRHGDDWCDDCPRRDAEGFALPPRAGLYNALRVKYQERMTEDTFTVVTKCLAHIPDGSWVEERDPSTRVDDPGENRAAQHIANVYLNSKKPRETKFPGAPRLAPSGAKIPHRHGDKQQQRHRVDEFHGPTVRRVFEP